MLAELGVLEDQLCRSVKLLMRNSPNSNINVEEMMYFMHVWGKITQIKHIFLHGFYQIIVKDKIPLASPDMEAILLPIYSAMVTNSSREQ
jgi:hypothetical protein